MSINNLVDYSINDTADILDIRTEKIEPISSSALVYKFRIDNVGYLDENSMLVFKCNKSSTATGGHRLRVNAWNGGLGGVKRCTFSVGDFIVNDFDELNRISTLENLNVPPGRRNEFWSHYIQNHLEVEPAEAAETEQTGAAQGGAGSIVSSVLNGSLYGDVTNNLAGAAPQTFSIQTDSTKNEKIGIPLGWIIPALKGRQFPLFLFQDYRVHIEVEFHGASKYVNNFSQAPGAGLNNSHLAAVDSDVDIAEVNLLIDYILPPPDFMNKDRESTMKEGGYRIEFPNYSVVKKTLPAETTARNLQEVEHRLGQNGKELHKIYQFKSRSGATLNKRIFLDQQINGVNEEEYNLVVNGNEIYPQYVWNNASQYHQMTLALDKELYVARPLYYSDDNTLFSQLTTKNTGLQAVFKPLACDMRNGNPGVVGAGTKIDNHPIVFKYRRRPRDSGTSCDDQKVGMDIEYHCISSRVMNVQSGLNGKGTQILITE